ncbi:MAG TPA: adenylate/guanylate cyclase domain-containing protein, partial [Chitinophagaceae bacterium]|nr:adenylate/guanylate cyclase domain-containing protein [Chitinophagaceae bacterium]
MPEHSHQLAAILFADIVNYTAMMQEDENAALEKITRFRHVIDIIVEELEGKIIQYYGDGCLVLFNSATDAVEFAKLLQTDFNEDPKVPVRIGIHMGDVLLRDGNVFGDVVNIASRIQALAPAGGIYISEMVYRNIANKKGMDSVFIKEEKLKNVKTRIRIYEVLTEYSTTVYHVNADDEQVAIDENSIAVLPFVNMSSDKEQEYFSDGLTEDIITQLSKIKSFKVISRTSVMQYKKTPKSIKEIGKELGVATILEGSVQRSPTKVRITAQLINAVSDEHLWSESYDRPVDDIFTIQREVALAIASVLNTTLTKKESQQLDYVPTVNLQAYDLYMRGKFLVEKRNKTDLLVARELFQQAVTKDRTFADAYSGLATTYLLSSFRGYEDPTRMLWLAKKNIDTALGLDPSSGEIQATLGYWYHQTFDWHAAEITYRRAIDLNANQSNVYLWLGILLEAKDEKEEALKVYNRGTELNPMWDYLVENRIRALVNNNQVDEAIALQKGLIEKAAADPTLQKMYREDLSRLYWFLNNKSAAIETAGQSGNKNLVKLYTDGDYSQLEKEVDRFYNELRDKSEYVSQVWMGIDYARAGARDKALDCFNN